MIANTIWLPWRLPSPRNICSYCLIWLLLMLNVTDVLTANCKTIPCLHGSPCEEAKSSGILTTRCLCPLGWVGSHCQTEFHVSSTTVTMTTVTLLTSTNNKYIIDKNVDGRRGLRFEKFYQPVPGETDHLNEGKGPEIGLYDLESNSVQYPEYSIQYWSRNQTNLCNILPKTSENVVTISGLRGNTDYIFCAKTSQIKQCNFDLVNQYSNVSYCISVKTSNVNSVPLSAVPTLYVILLISGAVVSSLVLVIILLYAVKRRYFCSNTCASHKNARNKRKSASSTYDTNVESLLLQSPATNRNDVCVTLTDASPFNNSATTNLVKIHKPSSPGKPEHHLVHKRMRGYAAFTARNEQTIALNTVIEYDIAEEEADEVDEPDVIVPTQRLGTFMSDVQNV